MITIGNTYQHLKRCASTYQGSEALKSRYANCDVMEVDDVLFMWENSEAREQVLTIRGTANMRNILTDALAFPVPLWSCGYRLKVHRGFFKASESIFSWIMKFGEYSKTKNITITGHSLGGAVSAILALMFEDHNRRNAGTGQVYCVNFGQPKFCLSQSANTINKILDNRYLRVVNHNDLVPNVPTGLRLWPFKKRLWNYQHTGREMVLSDSFKLYVHPVTRDHNFFTQIFVETANEHHTDQYIKTFSRLMRESGINLKNRL